MDILLFWSRFILLSYKLSDGWSERKSGINGITIFCERLCFCIIYILDLWIKSKWKMLERLKYSEVWWKEPTLMGQHNIVCLVFHFVLFYPVLGFQYYGIQLKSWDQCRCCYYYLESWSFHISLRWLFILRREAEILSHSWTHFYHSLHTCFKF